MSTPPVVPLNSSLVNPNSNLHYFSWVRRNMLEAHRMSPFDALIGKSNESVIYKAFNENGGMQGHQVVFDILGEMVKGGITDDQTASGKGETFRLFEDSLWIQQFRYVGKHPTRYEAHDVNRNNLADPQPMMNALRSRYLKYRDQRFYDNLQGLLARPNGGGSIIPQHPTHLMVYGVGGSNGVAKFSYDQWQEVQENIAIGENWAYGSKRRPLDPFKTEMTEQMLMPQRNCYLMFIDASVAKIIKNDINGFRNIMTSGDVRGNKNRVIEGVIGKIDEMIFVKIPTFYGKTAYNEKVGAYDTTATGDAAATGVIANKANSISEIENPNNVFPIEDERNEIYRTGLRQRDGNGYYSGQPNFGVQQGGTQLHNERWVRCPVVGGSAMQYGIGLEPTFTRELKDGGNQLESFLTTWYSIQKTKLKEAKEGSDYEGANITGIDLGCFCVDIRVK